MTDQPWSPFADFDGAWQRIAAAMPPALAPDTLGLIEAGFNQGVLCALLLAEHALRRYDLAGAPLHTLQLDAANRALRP